MIHIHQVGPHSPIFHIACNIHNHNIRTAIKLLSCKYTCGSNYMFVGVIYIFHYMYLSILLYFLKIKLVKV